MMRSLLVDGVRREMSAYVLTGILSAFWGGMMVHVFALRGAIIPGLVVGVPMALAFVLGPWHALGMPRRRELRLLPIPHATLWHAHWTLGTLVAPAWIGLSTLAGAALASRVSMAGLAAAVPLILLAMVVHVAYCGACFIVPVVTAHLLRRAPWRLARARARPHTVILQTGMWVGIAVPLVLGTIGRLPMTWADLQGRTAAVLLVALALSLVALQQVPPRVESRDATPAPQTGTFGIALGTTSGPTGMRLFFLRELAIAAVCATALTSLLVAIAWTFSGADGLGRELQEPLGRFAREGLPYLQLAGILAIVGMPFNWFIWLSGRNGAVPLLRQLRTLPVSRLTLTGWVLVCSAFFWVGTLGLLTALVVSLTGQVPALRADLLVLVAGMIALGHAVNVAYGRAFGFGPAAMPLVFGSVATVLHALPEPVTQLASPLGLGVTGLVAAALVTYALLGRSRTYRARPASPGTGRVG
jgi:hypothetical protein